MNVLIVAQYFPPDIGGAASRASNIAKGLTLNGCRVTVIAPFPHYPLGIIPKEYRKLPIKVEYIGKTKIIRTFMLPIKSQGFVKRLLLMAVFATSALFALPWVGKIDAIYASSWVPGLFYGKMKRAPVALNVDDLTIEDLSELGLMKEDSLILKIGTAIYRHFYVKGDVVTPISPGYIGVINRKYCVDIKKIQNVNIGVDLKMFKVRDNSNTCFKIIYAGLLGIGYDFEQIFKAAKILADNGVNVEFILHGDGECKDSIRNRIKDLHLTNVKLNTKLFGSREEVAVFLSSADALILPMKDYSKPYRGIPSKLYEYQALGKPIICCARGEPADYIVGSKSGIAVKPGDYMGIVEAISALYNDRETAKRLGTAGRLFVEEHSSLEKIGLRMKRVLMVSAAGSNYVKQKKNQ